MNAPRKAAATLGALALGGALLAAAAPAQAATPSAQPPSIKTVGAPKSDGAKGICKRVPKLQLRIENAITRLNGPDTVAGSIARLQVRVNDAQNAGQTAIYNYLNDRLTYRKSLLPTLTTRQSDLNAVATWCSSQGLGPTDAASPAAQ
ncbi:hypothetical protein ACIGXM_19225 [Kitasatospora sp. NPDC052896]|uniref:hypothetical protein n=1 Tax=Kitasatospora sp. NPDC052896 TaxID=3364061 RepID=UPI0037C6FB0D